MEDKRRFTGRQITVMVVAICLAVIAAPIGALAATGQLVNITDPVNSAHKARVTSGGAVQAAIWAGVPPKYVNVEATAYGNGRKALVDTPNGQRLAVTQVTISYLGSGIATVDFWNWGVASTDTCSTATAGSPLEVLRRVYVQGNTTVDLNFNGPALNAPAPSTSGKHGCFIANITGSTNRVSFGVTGYKF